MYQRGDKGSDMNKEGYDGMTRAHVIGRPTESDIHGFLASREFLDSCF